MQFDSLIFDLDGTLWDTCDTCAIAWNSIIDRHNIAFRKITADDVRSVCGKPHEECIRVVFDGLPTETIDLLITTTMEEDNNMIKQIGGILYPDVREGLEQLAKEYKLFIVSNCQSGYIENFLDFTGLPHIFGDTECWGNTQRSKSENTMALISRNELRSPLFIGDTSGDLRAASDVGIPFAYLTYGFGKLDEYDYRFDSFKELTTWLLTAEL